MLSDGRIFTSDDANLLDDLHLYLEDRFARHLTLLRNRIGAELTSSSWKRSCEPAT